LPCPLASCARPRRASALESLSAKHQHTHHLWPQILCHFHNYIIAHK
jgi:hypothetical protein